MKDTFGFVLSNDRVAETLYIMRLCAPEVASTVEPGQFVQMEMPGLDAHILRRPFSIFAADPHEGTIDILYQVVGSATEYMTFWREGFSARLLGPLGNTWSPPTDAQRVLLVGGGVGAAPLFMLYEKLAQADLETDVILGATTKANLVCFERYCAVCGKQPLCSTDDGTFGEAGFCTPLVERALAEAQNEGASYDYVAICGPEPLMKSASSYALAAQVSCEVSLEKRMACGIGACLSCVVDTTSGKARVCADGPIFNAGEIVW